VFVAGTERDLDGLLPDRHLLPPMRIGKAGRATDQDSRNEVNAGCGMGRGVGHNAPFVSEVLDTYT
jgi:hypothetical protein